MTNNGNNYRFTYAEFQEVIKSGIFITGVIISVLVWFIDPVIDAVFLEQGFISELLLRPDPHEILFRSIISTFIIVFSFYSSLLLIRTLKVENEHLQLYQRLEEAQRLGEIGSWELDLVTNRLYWSDEVYRMFEIDQEEFDATFESFLDRIHPDDRERVKLKYNHSVKTNSPYEITHRLVLKDGSIKFVNERGKTFYDDNGNAIRSIGTVQDITERKLAERQLSFQATHDALTGLANRREFERRANRLLKSAKESGNDHALCFMDLDQFKVVNDTCGHVAGDELLRQLSQLLQEKVRHRDTLARLGGDEFGILMEHCPLDDAHRVAMTLQKEIQAFCFSWDDKIFKVGVSIGLVSITAATHDLTELLKKVDAACYVAKDKGRNRIHVSRNEDFEVAQRHGEMQWITKINRAIEDNSFCLYGQLICPLDKTKEKYCEILVRMVDENSGLIVPGSFLPAAERYNMITKIDYWVIENTIAFLTSNPQVLEEITMFNINLSGQSLNDPDFLGFIISLMNESEIDCESVCFEITETAAISNMVVATRFISILKGLGCSFTLDDFGSGLSSFGYLKSLPVDYLKIDGMFVKNIINDPIDYAMVSSINKIGQVMGMKTIAEFVENNEIRDMLTKIGVNYAQGYGISRPQPLEDFLTNSSDIIASKSVSV